MFPDLDGDAFRDAMAAIDRALSAISHLADGSCDGRDAVSLARRALPADDSTLQWSPLGSGLTDDLAKTLERLYTRLVVRYDSAAPARRTDADIWRPVRDKLHQRDIKIELAKKTVVGATDEISFKYAWRNGIWHAYEPLSFDLADAEGIKSKAHRWRGHLDAAAGGSEEPLKLNFIVGAPPDAALRPAYRRALDILRDAAFRPALFEDNQVDELVDEIESEVRTHAQTR
jgi:hypothetical protein